MGILEKATQQHVTDYAIVDLAETLTGLMFDETPGVGPMQELLSVVLSQKLIGRVVAGLAEAILLFQREGSGPAAGDPIRKLAEHLSLLGSILADQSGPPPRLPDALVVRLAGRLERAADQHGAAEGLAARLAA